MKFNSLPCAGKVIYSGYWKTMKAKIVGITSALGMIASGALSQNNSHFDVLETKQGNFTNALVYPANASGVVVNYDGGIAAVSFTNLSSALQKQLGYDPTKAAAEAAALIQRKIRDNQIAQKAAIKAAAFASLAQNIRIIEIIDNFGRCRIQTTNGTMKVRMMGTPKSVDDYFDAFKNLQAKIDEQTAQVENSRLAARQAEANVPDVPMTVVTGGYGYDADYYAARTAEIDRRRILAKTLAANAANAAENLDKMKSQLAELKEKEKDATTIQAYPTGELYGELPSWQAKH